MRKLLLLLILLFAVDAKAQTNSNPANPLGGNVNLVDAGTCSTYGSYFWQKLPLNASTTTVNLAGTFSGTVTVRESNNGGGTWTTAGTQTGVGTSSYTTNGFTDVCADVTTYASGIIQITVTTGVGVNNGGAGGSSFPLTTPGAVGNGGSISVTPGSSGSIAGVQTASPPMGLYLTNQCPTGNTTACFYTPANTVQYVDCSWTGSTATCTGSHFTAANVGMTVFGYTNCDAFNSSYTSNAVSGAIANSGVAPPTVLSQGGTTLGLSGAVNNVQAGNTHCLIIGNPDDTGAAAIDTAAQAATQCPKIFFAAAYYMLAAPHWFTQPTACSNAGSINGGSFGNILFAAGYELEGRGRLNTQIFLAPNLGPCTNGPQSNACFVRTLEGQWKDFQFTGGMNSQGIANTALIYVVGPGALQNFTCTNWGNGLASTIGIEVTGWDRWDSVDNSGCGAIGIDVANNFTGAYIRGVHVAVENSPAEALVIQNSSGLGYPDFACWDCVFAAAQGTPSVTIRNIGGWLRMDEGLIGLSTSTAISAYISQGTNAVLDLHGVSFNNAGTQASAYINNLTAGTNYLENVNMVVGASVVPIQDGFAASKTYDQGGNQGLTPNSNITGQVFGEQNSSAAATVTAAKLVLSAGWGSTAANTALSGGDFPIQFTITNSGTGQGATPTITYTFPTPLLVAPFSCTAVDIGGNNPLLNPFTTSSLTKTGAVFTATGTPTVSDTEIMNITCVTP
jgi:hypothetical protein